MEQMIYAATLGYLQNLSDNINTQNTSSNGKNKKKAIIFDLDNTIYPVSSIGDKLFA